MSKLIKDPESYFTDDRVLYMPKLDSVEERLKGKTGKHDYELCLLQTYWQTEKYFKLLSEADKVAVVNHLFSLKADIMRYCMPHYLDWKALMKDKRSYLVVTPDHKSSMFYRLMANNLLIIDETLVSRFLDFHLVNTILKHKLSKEYSPNVIEEALIRFIQEIDYMVVFSLEHNMPFVRTTVIEEIKAWVRKQMDNLGERLLVHYHAYEFDSETTGEYKPYETISHAHLKVSCPPTVVKDYFQLLTNNNPEAKGNVPFVSNQKVNYILNQWFGIGEENTDEQDPTVTIERAQLLYFLYNFKLHFCKSRNRGMVKSEDLIRLALKEFDDLFLGVELSNQVQNFKRDANQKGSYHRSLDFKQYPTVMKSYEELKKSKTI